MGMARVIVLRVTINVTNVNDNAPVFTDGISTTRTVEENTASGFNVGSTVSATDADTGDTSNLYLGWHGCGLIWCYCHLWAAADECRLGL